MIKDIPQMLAPEDFPDFNDKPPVKRRRLNRSARVEVEYREMRVLLDFHQAFAQYLADRYNPARSADVLGAYRNVSQYYLLNQDQG